MSSEFGPLLESARDFDVTIADTPDKLRAAYQLRHQVYCTELGYEPGQESALEMDCFDRHASHALLTRRSTGQMVGTVRIVVRLLSRCGTADAALVPSKSVPSASHGVHG